MTLETDRQKYERLVREGKRDDGLLHPREQVMTVVEIDYEPEECFGLYVYDGRRGRGGLRQIATGPTLHSIGTALAQNIEDCQAEGETFPEGFIGIRDITNRKWIINPFPGGGSL